MILVLVCWMGGGRHGGGDGLVRTAMGAVAGAAGEDMEK